MNERGLDKTLALARLDVMNLYGQVSFFVLDISLNCRDRQVTDALAETGRVVKDHLEVVMIPGTSQNSRVWVGYGRIFSFPRKCLPSHVDSCKTIAPIGASSRNYYPIQASAM